MTIETSERGGETFELTMPMTDAKGQSRTSMTLIEPELGHKIRAGRHTDPAQQTIDMIAALSGVPAAEVELLLPMDAMAMSSWVQARLAPDNVGNGQLRTVIELWIGEAGERIAPDVAHELLAVLEAMGHIPPPAATTEAAAWQPEPQFTLTLAAPVQGQASITVKAPSLGAAVGLAKFKSEAEQTAAMIAKLSGWTIPQVNRLRMTDVAAIEDYLAPFSKPGARKRATPGATAMPQSAPAPTAVTDGAT